MDARERIARPRRQEREPEPAAAPRRERGAAAVLALQRSVGNRAVVQRLTNPAVYPRATTERFKTLRNLETDVDNKLVDKPLADGAVLRSENGDFALSVDLGSGVTIPVAITLANSTAPDYTPTSYVLSTTAPWSATVTVHANLPGESLKGALTREFNEMAFRVKAATNNGGTAAAGEGQPGIFVNGPTPATAVATASDQATAIEIKALWDKHNGPKPDFLKAIVPFGLASPHLLAVDDKKLVALGGVGLTAKNIEDLRRATHVAAIKLANPTVPGDVEYDADLLEHIMVPGYRQTFLTTGISGGHLDSVLKSFVDGHAVLHIAQVAATGQYHKYLQYRWTGGGAKPPLDQRPQPGQPLPPQWEQAEDTSHVALPKSTFENVDTFLQDALAAFAAWKAAQPDTVAKKSNADFGIKQPAAVSPTTGQSFGGYFAYKNNKWTLDTIFPIL